MDWVEGQIDASDLDDEAGVLVLAALEGDQQLDEYLTTGTSTERALRGEGAARAGAARGTFLSSITVEGFRGIGPATTLTLSPAPGLTIVAGRNGSGKSSFSEALELVLTGDTYRWKARSAQWRQQWRNLHHPDTRITVGLVEEGEDPLTIVASWPSSAASVEDHTVCHQRKGGRKRDGIDELGWKRSLDLFRPILSYDELGGMLEGRPSDLYDAIARVLGVEQIGDALKRIQVRHKILKTPRDDAGKRRRALNQAATDLDDERARAAALLLKKTSPDVAALRAIATGSADVDQGPVPALRALAALMPPARTEDAVAAAGQLRRAVAELADAGAEASARNLGRLELLEHALRLHAEHGDMSCPVCRTGVLDADWLTTSQGLVEAERRQFRDVDLAKQSLRLALDHARTLLAAHPAALDRAPVPELDDAVAEARAAWDRWVQAPAGGDAATATRLADHLERHRGDLAARLEDLRGQAARKVAELDDQWQPLATQIGAWCAAWEEVERNQRTLEVLAAAEAWLKGIDLLAKNDRLEPIREGARQAWTKLRQESNVEIGELALEGTATHRRVRIDSLVDGTPAEGLAVLSQGELHALALSLFLPRATMAESPFRFLVLDDPVQAMDPAKVDGLVDLLRGMASTHQVVVLSHDDRLADAVRRSDLAATILEVTRGEASQVSVAPSTDPARRYLDDAFALVKEWEEHRLAETALRRTLPGLLRFAVEAAAKDRFFSGRLLAGQALSEVESVWDAAASTRQRVTLALFGEPRETHELDHWAAAPYRKLTLRTVSGGMHHGLPPTAHPKDVARDAERMVEDLRGLPG